MLKGLILGVLLTVLAAALAAYAAIRTGAIPANADRRAPGLERWAARQSLAATLRRSAPRIDDPLPATDRQIVAGVKLYAQNCAVCHGTAQGISTKIARGLYQHPPQLAKDGVEDDPEGATFWKVAHGIRWTGMPSFGRSLSERQIWQLVLFLKKMDRLPPLARKAWRQVRVSEDLAAPLGAAGPSR